MEASAQAEKANLLEVFVVGGREMLEVKVYAIHFEFGGFLNDSFEINLAVVEGIPIRKGLQAKLNHE
jgi:hypothetical protein